jgi:hypothetical protein
MALQKVSEEFEKFRLIQKQTEKEQSLKELEADLKNLKSVTRKDRKPKK